MDKIIILMEGLILFILDFLFLTQVLLIRNQKTQNYKLSQTELPHKMKIIECQIFKLENDHIMKQILAIP
jgi:hypothetical protein